MVDTILRLSERRAGQGAGVILAPGRAPGAYDVRGCDFQVYLIDAWDWHWNVRAKDPDGYHENAAPIVRSSSGLSWRVTGIDGEPVAIGAPMVAAVEEVHGACMWAASEYIEHDLCDGMEYPVVYAYKGPNLVAVVAPLNSAARKIPNRRDVRERGVSG